MNSFYWICDQGHYIYRVKVSDTSQTLTPQHYSMMNACCWTISWVRCHTEIVRLHLLHFGLYECQREFITFSGGIFFFGEKKRGGCVFVWVCILVLWFWVKISTSLVRVSTQGGCSCGGGGGCGGKTGFGFSRQQTNKEMALKFIVCPFVLLSFIALVMWELLLGIYNYYTLKVKSLVSSPTIF